MTSDQSRSRLANGKQTGDPRASLSPLTSFEDTDRCSASVNVSRRARRMRDEEVGRLQHCVILTSEQPLSNLPPTFLPALVCLPLCRAGSQPLSFQPSPSIHSAPGGIGHVALFRLRRASIIPLSPSLSLSLSQVQPVDRPPRINLNPHYGK